MEKDLCGYILEGELLEVLTYPDTILTTPSKSVEVFDDKLKLLCKNMLYTMYNAPGIGLAAPQIGLNQRIFVLDVNYKREETSEGSEEYHLSEFTPQIFINPVITDKKGETLLEEGCLSLPGVFESVQRFENVSLNYKNTDGISHSIDATELLGICIQHENDHLDGVVFIDKLSLLKKKFIKKKLIKTKKQGL